MYQVNRFVAIIIPKQPFYDWLSHTPSFHELELTLEELQHDCTAFLIPSFEDEASALHYIYTHYEMFFEGELQSWYSDDTVWPVKRTGQMFKDWFLVSVHSVVVDVVEDDELENDNITSVALH